MLNGRWIIALILLLAAAGPAKGDTELNAEVGWVSEYVFRGAPQTSSSAFAGLELDSHGWHVGTWIGDVGDGVELNLFGGYVWERNDWSFGIGATGYYYTGDFDDTYEELNFSLGFRVLSLEYSIGNYANFDGSRQRYDYWSASLEQRGVLLRFGQFGRDFSGHHVDLGYSFEAAGLDFAIVLTHASSELADQGGSSDQILQFGLSRSFPIGRW